MWCAPMNTLVLVYADESAEKDKTRSQMEAVQLCQRRMRKKEHADDASEEIAKGIVLFLVRKSARTV
jgi:hypothetical protein